MSLGFGFLWHAAVVYGSFRNCLINVITRIPMEWAPYNPYNYILWDFHSSSQNKKRWHDGVIWAFVAIVLCHDGNPSQSRAHSLREILMGRKWMKRVYWRRRHLNGVRERIGMVVVLGLLSEIYTQLHTIDGLPGPQTYKSSISMGSYPQFVFLHTSYFEHHRSILRPAKRNAKMQLQLNKNFPPFLPLMMKNEWYALEHRTINIACLAGINDLKLYTYVH